MLFRSVLQKENVKVKLNKYQIAEQNLLYYMLNSKEVIQIYEQEKPRFSNHSYNILARSLVHYLKENNAVQVSNLLTYYQDDKELITVINELLQLNIKDEYSIQEIKDYIKVIKDKSIQDNIKQLQVELKQEKDKSKKIEILQKMIERRKLECDGDE